MNDSPSTNVDKSLRKRNYWTLVILVVWVVGMFVMTLFNFSGEIK